ncbi:helix-turn-helix domain-containing protein [Pseudomonas sp. NPDC086112]|uniref:AlbA family DNA-binding domain-containing protein n=1 Tax=Pseudomonas sp. NPDC086112 TaxID=3364430 RepID=UPI003800ED67
MTVSRERLADLLIDTREALECEVKNWLDLQGSNEDKATFAKAVLALANHGGGFIILGLAETDVGILEAGERPATLDSYNQDLVNGIVQNYCDPPFHCAVHIVANPLGAVFPVVQVPGGHRVPVRARRAGPNGNTVHLNAIYVRKPGPRSETPQSAQDWDDLLARCLRNRRDEMFDQIRDLISGAVPQVERPPEPARLDEWIRSNRERWTLLTEALPEGDGPRMPHGRFFIAYEVIGERRQIPLAQFPDVLRASVVRHTGWPPFWYPTRAGIVPYPIDGAVECWMGNDREAELAFRDPSHSDFWRIHPDGLAFLLRGYQEDDSDAQRLGRIPVPPATIFDITLPVWRIGEALLQARCLAANLFEGPTTIKFVATYEGLAGRSLVSMDGSRHMWDGRVSRQDTITLSTHIDAQTIDANLPEIVHPLLSPLYALFDFFELPMQLVVDELARMRGGNF